MKSSKTRKASNRVATAFRRAAQSAGNSHTALGGFHRRMRARPGPPRPSPPPPHKLSRIFYRMWKYRQPYKDLGIDYYESNSARHRPSLSKRAASLGFQLVQITNPDCRCSSARWHG